MTEGVDLLEIRQSKQPSLVPVCDDEVQDDRAQRLRRDSALGPRPVSFDRYAIERRDRI